MCCSPSSSVRRNPKRLSIDQNELKSKQYHSISPNNQIQLLPKQDAAEQKLRYLYILTRRFQIIKVPYNIFSVMIRFLPDCCFYCAIRTAHPTFSPSSTLVSIPLLEFSRISLSGQTLPFFVIRMTVEPPKEKYPFSCPRLTELMY